ncbi:hypothetical protein JCGZ_00295 [Jatropha curcas]|uniref:Cytochrome P450 n=1 Tax=Jatropha curcas TaxID=180498 RepID=A0A067L5H8_JATCU|nr:hypothetical protein JCGZ_00295 [Jatropha curcas]
MEIWFVIVISLSIAALLKPFLNLFFISKNSTISLPPRPLSFVGSILWLKKTSFWEFESTIRSFHAKFGSMVALPIGTKLHFYVADGRLAHQALIQNGVSFASRPPPTNTYRIISCNQHNIGMAFYGPTWRLLRRNLVSEMLHPSVVKSYSEARKWALQILIERLESQSKELPDMKRKLNEEEIVTLCDEFFNGGTESTSTALQWIMANLVKYPHIQEKLFMEMKMVVGNEEEEHIKEEDLHKMKYLKAVILEGLRRHPPSHMLLPHAVSDDVVLGNYLVPKNGIINFMVADIGLDPKVWEDPMEFKPERFNGDEAFDIKGSREIKMMPFGAGRRICPGYSLGLFHLEYFVANLVWKFEWKAVDGNDIDLSEKTEVIVVMKNPLKAHLSPRFKKI